MLLKDNDAFNVVNINKNKYKVERIYNGKKLSVIKILNMRGKICKALFYDENERISNMSIYNASTGKETKNITYRSDGTTVSSIRIYRDGTDKLEKVIFCKPDGISISSLVLYDSNGMESECILYSDSGEVLKFKL